MYCFSPSPRTHDATGLEAAVCKGEYLHLNKNPMNPAQNANPKTPHRMQNCQELSFGPDTVYNFVINSAQPKY